MKALIALILFIHLSIHSMSDDSDGWFFYPPQTPCTPAPVTFETIVKPELLEEYHTPVQTDQATTLANVVVKSEPIDEPQIPAAAIHVPLSSLSQRNPVTIKEDSVSFDHPFYPKKKKRDYAWRPMRRIEPSRIPGKHKCTHPECNAVLRYSWGLKQHTKRVHGNPVRWGCPFFYDTQKQCRTTFITNSDYRRHLRIKHHTSYDVVQKRALDASDTQTATQPRSIQALAHALAHGPRTRSLSRLLNAHQEH